MRVLTIISGIIMVLMGAICLMNPGETFMNLAFLIGAVMVFCGIIHLLTYLIGRGMRNKGDNNGWILINALLTLLLGVLIMCNQLTVDMAIPMIFGTWMLVAGLLRIEAATRIDRNTKPKNFKAALITGVITLMVGLIGFINPLITYISIMYVLGFFLIVQGINSVELGLNMPHERKEETVKVFFRKREPVKINDELHENDEAVEIRKRAQLKQRQEAEFFEKTAIKGIGISREDFEKAIQEDKEAKSAQGKNNEV